MLTILLCLLCFFPALYSADTPVPESVENTHTARLKDTLKQAAQLEKSARKTSSLSGQMIKIQCSDEAEPSEYLYELVNYSKTIRDFIGDMGTENNIPLSNVTKKTFDCLINFAKILHDHKNRLPDVRQTFREKLTPEVSTSELLLATNYLDIDTFITEPNPSAEGEATDKKSSRISFKDLIASLHANFLKTNLPTIHVSTDNIISCDNLPIELESLVAKWLLHDLLKSQEPVEKSAIFFEIQLQQIGDKIISSSGSSNSFCGIWMKTGRADSFYLPFDSSDLNNDNYFHIKLTDSPKHIPSICVISSDKKWMIITGKALNEQNHFKYSFASIYDLSTPKEILSPIKVIDLALFNANRPSGVFFNSKNNTFDIVTEIYETDQNKKVITLLYSSITTDANDKSHNTKTKDVTNLKL